MFFGLLYFAIGIYIISMSNKGRLMMKQESSVLGYFFLVWGILLCVAEINWGATSYGLLLSMGLGMVIMLIACINMSKVVFCNQRIEALYTGPNALGKKKNKFSPVFQYMVEGKRIQHQSGKRYTKEQLDNLFEEGKTYEVFVHSRYPRIYLLERKITVRDLFILAAGILMILWTFSRMTF